MSRLIQVVGLVTGLVVGVVLTLTMGTSSAEEPAQWIPPAKTIIAVEGDAANGFGIYYYDGSSIFPPTDSEAKAECLEYDTRVDRVRCYTEVRVWYRELGRMRNALRYAYQAALHD